MNIVLNMESVFGRVPLDEAFGIMRSHGFDTFERWMIAKEELPALKGAMEKHHMKIKACCPDFFILNDPSRRAEYLCGLEQGIRTIRDLGGDQLITQVGADTGVERAAQHAAVVGGLKAAVKLLEESGVTLLVEPLNDVKDHPGYFLTSSEEGFQIVNEVGSPNVRLLYDVYHQLHMGEDVMREIKDHLPLIGHFHVAGFPGRDERIHEGFDYAAFSRMLQDGKIGIPVGIELFPSSSQAIGPLLHDLAAYR